MPTRFRTPFALAAAVLITLARHGVANEALPIRTVPPEPEATRHFVGNNSCALKGCHNGIASGIGSEYRTWNTQDAHSRSFDVLRDARSQTMAQALGLKSAAHEADLCLKCHSTTTPAVPRSDKFQRSEGVSCEACHGPASDWLEPHIRRDWRAQSKPAKAEFGLLDLSSPKARVERCLDCHVGTPGFEVTHDLIAAGHPRLMFEATAFYDAMPRHWDESQTRQQIPTLDAQVWLAGQTATLRRASELMVSRPAERALPEWSDHNCYACHRSLNAQSLGRSSRDGGSTWGAWPHEFSTLAMKHSLAAPASLLDTITPLREQLRLTKFHRDAVQAGLQSWSKAVIDWDAAAVNVTWSTSQLRAVMLDLAAPVDPSGSDWEVAWQRYRGLSALSQSLNELSSRNAAAVANRVAELKLELRLPKGFVSPKNFDAAAFNRRLDEVRQALLSSR